MFAEITYILINSLIAAFCKYEEITPPPPTFPYKRVPEHTKQRESRPAPEERPAPGRAAPRARGSTARAAPPGCPARSRARGRRGRPRRHRGSRQGRAAAAPAGRAGRPGAAARRPSPPAAAGPTYRPGGLCPGPALLPAALLPHVGRGGAQLTPGYPGSASRPGGERRERAGAGERP